MYIKIRDKYVFPMIRKLELFKTRRNSIHGEQLLNKYAVKIKGKSFKVQ